MTKKQVVDELKQQLAGEGLKRFKLDVFENGVHKDGDWWYVPINPKDPHTSAFDYVRDLDKVEDYFKNERHVNVLLVPAVGED